MRLLLKFGLILLKIHHGKALFKPDIVLNGKSGGAGLSLFAIPVKNHLCGLAKGVECGMLPSTEFSVFKSDAGFQMGIGREFMMGTILRWGVGVCVLFLSSGLWAAAGFEQKITGICQFAENSPNPFVPEEGTEIKTVDMAAAPVQKGAYCYRFSVKLGKEAGEGPLVLELDGIQGELFAIEWDGEKLYPPEGPASAFRYLICKKQDLAPGVHFLTIKIKDGAPGKGPFRLRSAKISEFWKITLQSTKTTGDFTASEEPLFYFGLTDLRSDVELETLELLVVIAGKGGKEVCRYKYTLDYMMKMATLNFGIDILPAGEYTMNVTMKNNKNEVLEVKWPFKILKK